MYLLHSLYTKYARVGRNEPPERFVTRVAYFTAFFVYFVSPLRESAGFFGHIKKIAAKWIKLNFQINSNYPEIHQLSSTPDKGVCDAVGDVSRLQWRMSNNYNANKLLIKAIIIIILLLQSNIAMDKRWIEFPGKLIFYIINYFNIIVRFS